MKNIIICFALCIPALVYSQENNCTIKGKVYKLGSDAKAYLTVNNILTDSLNIENGEFLFFVNADTNKLDFGTVIVRYTDKKTIMRSRPFYLSPGQMLINITDPSIKLMDMTIDGPPLTMDYDEKLLSKALKNNALILTTRDKLKSAQRSNMTDTSFLKNEIDSYVKANLDNARAYINGHPSSILSIRALIMMGSGDPYIKNPTAENQKKDLIHLFETLSTHIKTSAPGKLYMQELEKME